MLHILVILVFALVGTGAAAMIGATLVERRDDIVSALTMRPLAVQSLMRTSPRVTRVRYAARLRPLPELATVRRAAA